MHKTGLTRMRTKFYQAGVALAVMLAAAGTATAQGEFTGNVALTTDYVFRGISQTNEDFGLSGGFDYTNGMFYAGVWAANVDFNDASDTNMELDFYGGVAGEFTNGISWDVGLVYYTYPDAEDEDLEVLEITGALGYEFESGFNLGGMLAYDPDNKNTYIEASAGYALTDALSLGGTLGTMSYDDGEDYTNWSLGGTYSLKGFDLDLRYWGTDIEGDSLSDDRIVFTISRSL